MFKNLIVSLLGGFGLIKKELKFKKSDWKAFAKTLRPGSYLVTRDRTPNFVQGGIQACTNSAWQHAVLYVGKSWGKRIREKYPWLLENPKIAKKAVKHEMIEAVPDGIVIDSLDYYNDNDNQLNAWSKPMDERDIEKVLLQAYLMVGGKYDYKGLAHHVFPFIPNPAKTNYCNEVVYYAHKLGTGERLKPSYIKEPDMFPRHLRDYGVSSPEWVGTRFNW